MTAASSSEIRRPWADLPVEMLDAVVKHTDLFSATRLAAVCKPWSEAVETNPKLPFGKPCLLMTRERDDYNDDDMMGYYTNAEQYKVTKLMDFGQRESTWEVSLPAQIWGAWEQRWIGGKDDWLATVDDDYRNPWLVNPYSGNQIGMPNTVRRGTTTLLNDDDAVLRFRRIVLCQTPKNDAAGISGYLAVAVINTTSIDNNVLAIARGGGGEDHDESCCWQALRDPGGHPLACSDVVVHKGKVFAVSVCGNMYAWNITCPDDEPEVIKPPDDVNDLRAAEFSCSWRLAESADGRRLVLVCIYGKEEDRYETTGYRRRFFVYTGYRNEGVRLYERDEGDESAADNGSSRWSAVVCLGGDNSLFLGMNCPFWAPIVVERRRDSSPSWPPQLRPNCVYVTNNNSWRSQVSKCDVEVFDLGIMGRSTAAHRSSTRIVSTRSRYQCGLGQCLRIMI